ncbi:MAG: tRNA lysidine(34) synthetase TilS [Gemmatimonadaceae bacterium]|nr:tRNA lysidine(34) synthetase TilS [Gemmatimonadaceae bacterium]
MDGVRLAQRALLAVSGGADSMVMASVLFDASPERIAGIATFDHGTGAAAEEAASLVVAWAESRRLPAFVGRASGLAQTESSWRQARWSFLHGVAARTSAAVATAHTRDDQVETVFMRLLRGSGVRGLAGLLARGPILRPMLGTSRVAVRAYATVCAVPFLDDPSNENRRFLRNRVRQELLPLLERNEPGFREWLITLGERAAVWRDDVSDAVDEFWAPSVQDGVAVHVPRVATRLPDRSEAALFWPEVAGRVGVALDWRGTARLASFTTKERTGLRMPLSGGVVVRSERRGWTLERAGMGDESAAPPICWHHATTD